MNVLMLFFMILSVLFYYSSDKYDLGFYNGKVISGF